MGRNCLSPEILDSISAEIITATRELISKNGIDNLTARAIAAEAGINVAIIYRHFADVDELKAYACLDLFQDYVAELVAAAEEQERHSAIDLYMLSWQLFCKHCFEHPRSAFSIFFGKYKGQMAEQIKRYYALFPKKRVSSSVYDKMLEMSNLFDRNLQVLTPVLYRKKTDAEIEQINEITILYFKGLLEEEIRDPDLKKEALSEKMLNACKILIG